MKHHAFLACHPAVNLLYFVLVLTFSMFFLHPLCIAVSLCAALWCAAQLNGGAAVRRTALWLAPTARATARCAAPPCRRLTARHTKAQRRARRQCRSGAGKTWKK